MHSIGMRNNSGFLRDIFTDLASQQDSMQIARVLVVKNHDSYIAQSIELPQVNNRIVRCRQPSSIGILTGIVDANIINCLNANDIEMALEYISPNNKNSEENIILLMVDKFHKQIKNIDLRIEYTRAMEFDTEEGRNNEIEHWNKKKQDVELKVSNIQERIKDNKTCIICYDSLLKKTIVPCCNNAYCFKCINIWMSQNKACPFCRKALTTRDYYVVDEAANASTSTTTPDEDFSKQLHENNEKLHNMEIILEQNRTSDSKYLIFSSYENSFDGIQTMLKKLDIKYAFLKGNMYHINNTVEKYKKGSVQVLLVNTRSYGSGLNLENTTDVIMFHKFDTEIEKQVIGRAQRYGRSSRLNVWYLLYANEFAN
jgi:SNF2 family DNA or RNA helicase